MIVSTQQMNTELFEFMTISFFKVLNDKFLFITWKENRYC